MRFMVIVVDDLPQHSNDQRFLLLVGMEMVGSGQ